MTSPLRSSALLTTAKNLAGVGASAGRPPLSDLRRATSTAYYALFHQVVRHGSLVFLPTCDEEELAEVARWFTHTGVLKATQMVSTADSGAPLQQIRREQRTAVMALRSAAGGLEPAHGIQPLPPQLVDLCDAFQTMQEARHLADYDGNYDPYRPTTIGHIRSAENGLNAAWWLWRSGSTQQPARVNANEAYRCFLRLALLLSGGPKAR